MGRKRHTAEQIIRKLREAEVELGKGQTTGDVVRKLGITEQTYYKMAQGVRRPSARSGQAPEGAREGELSAEAGGGGPGAGQRHSCVFRRS